MTNTSVTLEDTGIAGAVNDGGRYESARNKMLGLDFATQAQQMKQAGAICPIRRLTRAEEAIISEQGHGDSDRGRERCGPDWVDGCCGRRG